MTVDYPQQAVQAIVATRAYWAAIWLARVANLVGFPTIVWLLGSAVGVLPAAPTWVYVLLWGVAMPALAASWGLLLRAGLLRPMLIQPDPRITLLVLTEALLDLIPLRRPRA